MEIKLGQMVRDTISGYEGKVVAITNWLYGCRRITVASDKLHDGKPVDSQCFDEPQLEIRDPNETKGEPTGGADRPTPPRTGH